MGDCEGSDLQRRLLCLSYNAGGSLSSVDSSRAFVGSISWSYPSWSIIFLSEVDHKLRHLEEFSYFTLDGHVVMRHWPGHGSFAIMFVVHCSIVPLLRDFQWQGRSGSVHLYSTCNSNLQNVNIVIAGIHGGHDDDLHTSLMHACTVIRKFTRHGLCTAQVAVVGDFNVDMLPSLACDPMADLPGRSLHHFERRCILYSWMETLGLDLVVPNSVVGSPGGDWALQAVLSPITRIPWGVQNGTPSCLDYAASSRNVITGSWIDWTHSFSDHALSAWEMNPVVSFVRKSRRVWVPVDEDICLDELRAMHLQHDMSCSAVIEKLSIVQSQHDSNLSCSERRWLRMPFQLREFYRKASDSVCEADRHMWQLRARILRRKWVSDMQLAARLRCVRAGKVLNKSKKLHQISAIVQGQSVITDRVDCTRAIAAFFSEKWGARNLHLHSELKSLMTGAEGCKLQISYDDICGAFKRLRNKWRRTCDRTCVRIWELLFIAQPTQFTDWLSCTLASSRRMADLQVTACAFGKLCSQTALADVRMIVPLASILQLYDIIIATQVDVFLRDIFPLSPTLMECARPRTQALDITSSLSLFVEKNLDLKSSGAIAQADVLQHYDTLALLRIARWLIAQGCPQSLAVAALRHQLCPKVRLSWNGFHADILDRTIGGITGSRVAGQLGRIPVLASLRKISAELLKLCWTYDGMRLVASTFVDNTFFLGSTVFRATKMADLFGSTLLADWNQRIKPSSKQVLAPYGSPDLVPHDESWAVLDSMKVLGHIVQSTGAVGADYDATVALLWRSFYANAGLQGNRRLPLRCKLQLLQRATLPHVDGHVVRWPYTKRRARQIDKVQRRMLSGFVHVDAREEDTAEEFCKRRNSAVATLQREIGRWSVRWAARVVSWDEHLRRTRNSWCWSAQLLQIRNPEELAARRLEFGRVSTRAVPGWLCTRWTESVELAKQSAV